MQHQQDEAQAQASNVEAAIALGTKREEPPSQDEGPSLPVDIWRHIHSLMPMRGAARAACLSHGFLSSWRRRPSLELTHEALGLNSNNEGDKTFHNAVGHILKKHSGIGLKSLRIETPRIYAPKHRSYLNSWLRIALKPGIEELRLEVFRQEADYNFPCSILSNGSGHSIRYLHLFQCSFRPVPGCCLRNLVSFNLCLVDITGDELGCLISGSLALETLVIRHCDEIVCLKVPHLLRRLSYLQVSACAALEFIDITAPNISKLSIQGNDTLKLSLGEAVHMKDLYIHRAGSLLYTCEKISYMVPNVEVLTMYSYKEMVNTPTMHSRLLHLRRLSIILSGTPFFPAYDYLSLASFFDAAPSLEVFKLDVFQRDMKHVPMFTDPAELRPMQERGHHDNIKSVKITGFYTAKSLIELVYYIVERITSLQFLTLEVPPGAQRCYYGCIKCVRMSSDQLEEARKALMAIKTYIEPKVPTTVKLHVVGPCSKCHSFNL